MCDFLIILHIVPLSLGLAFIPGIGCTTICRDLRVHCTHYRWIWFSCPLIWDKCSTSCVVLNDAGWCMELVRVPVKCCKLRMTCFTSCGVCWTSNLWRACGMIKTRASSFNNFCRFSFNVLQAWHILSENTKCVQSSAVNYSIKEPVWPTACFSCRGVQAVHLIMTVHTTFCPGCKISIFLLCRYPRLSVFQEA